MRERSLTKRLVAFSGLFLLLLLLPMTAVFAKTNTLIMATTTSTDNTGLLDYLIPQFIKDTGINLQWTATGTGKALRLGQNCDVDLLMVHAPPAEMKFMAKGFGMHRRKIMYNDFVIIGPDNDPANIKATSIHKALLEIKTQEAAFVSRGDNSGTHKKELSLWQAALLPVPEKENWYTQTGQGMLATINIAAEKNGYTLTDRGTYIKYKVNLKGNPPLKILVKGDKALLNQYSIMIINPDNCPNVKSDLALQFVKWITSPKAQQQIEDFRLLGRQLFTPNAKR